MSFQIITKWIIKCSLLETIYMYNILVSNEILPLGMVMLSLQFSAKAHFSHDTYFSCDFVNDASAALINIQLRNRLRVHMVCVWAWVSILGELDLPKSLKWCSPWSSDHTHRHVRTHTHRQARASTTYCNDT